MLAGERWKLRHAIQWSRLVPFIVGGALGIPIGAAALTWASPTQMSVFIGAALILFSVYSLARPNLPAVKGGSLADTVVGLLSGAFSGSTGLAGIPVIVWASLRRWSKDEQRAVFQPVVVAVFVMTLIWLGGTGVVTAETLRLFWIGLPAVLIGTWLGLKLYGKLDERGFRLVMQVFVQAESSRRIKVLWEVSVNTGTSRIPHTTPRGAVIRAAQCQRYQTS